MSTLTVKKQTPADKNWLDEQGQAIPYNRVNVYERTAEITLSKLAKDALIINSKLSAFKAQVRTAVDFLYKSFVEQNDGKIQGRGKGNITLYNFDRSIKVEVNVNEPIRFDEEFIKLAKAELDALLKDNLGKAADWISH